MQSRCRYVWDTAHGLGQQAGTKGRGTRAKALTSLKFTPLQASEATAKGTAEHTLRHHVCKHHIKVYIDKDAFGQCQQNFCKHQDFPACDSHCLPYLPRRSHGSDVRIRELLVGSVPVKQLSVVAHRADVVLGCPLACGTAPQCIAHSTVSAGMHVCTQVANLRWQRACSHKHETKAAASRLAALRSPHTELSLTYKAGALQTKSNRVLHSPN
eukprot:1136338-Pelagomonas_calceolata.AAC.4